MSALYGRMAPDGKKHVTRTAHREIGSVLETWEGEVRTVLFESGDFFVYVGEKGASLSTDPVFRGNVNDGSVEGQWSFLKRASR